MICVLDKWKKAVIINHENCNNNNNNAYTPLWSQPHTNDNWPHIACLQQNVEKTQPLLLWNCYFYSFQVFCAFPGNRKNISAYTTIFQLQENSMSCHKSDCIPYHITFFCYRTVQCIYYDALTKGEKSKVKLPLVLNKLLCFSLLWLRWLVEGIMTKRISMEEYYY